MTALLPVTELSEEQRELWQRVVDLWALSQTRDAARIGAALHSEYVGWDMSAPAPHDREAAVRSVSSDTPLVSAYALHPLSVQVYEHQFGVVHYTYSATVVPDGASAKNITGRWTEVYLKQAGVWMMVAVSGRPDKISDASRAAAPSEKLTPPIGVQSIEYTPQLEALLRSAGLPVADLHPDSEVRFLGVSLDGKLAAAVGLELFGEVGLLRSLAVAPEHRSTGLGRVLVQRAEARAIEQGVRALYLLTTTARDFFLHLGYREIPRAMAPAVIAGTRQFSALCPSSSDFMLKEFAASGKGNP